MATIIDNGSYAVNASDVAVCYKVDIDAVPPLLPSFALMVILSGVGKPQSPQLRFDDQAARDDFYKRMVAAMGKG